MTIFSSESNVSSKIIILTFSRRLTHVEDSFLICPLITVNYDLGVRKR